MIRLQQTQTMPDDKRLRIIATFIINWLNKYCLADFQIVKTMRETLKSNPAAALKHAAKVLITVVEESKGV